jgi:hypothetical protein
MVWWLIKLFFKVMLAIFLIQFILGMSFYILALVLTGTLTRLVYQINREYLHYPHDSFIAIGLLGLLGIFLWVPLPTNSRSKLGTDRRLLGNNDSRTIFSR